MIAQKKKGRIARRTRDLFLIGLITLILLEITLRVLQFFSESITIAVSPPNLNEWETRFVHNYDRGTFIYHGLLTRHPTLGWISKPNQSIVVEGDRYTTNAQGMRSLHDFRHEPDKYNVFVVGDSFTFGDEADDSFVWPTLLEQMDDRLNVLNFAVTAYGTDQMYLLLKQKVAEYKPDLVICALTFDDLNRAMMDFRDFAKPLLLLQDDRLVLTNTPIGDPDDVYHNLKRRQALGGSPLFVVNAVKNILQTDSRMHSVQECFILNKMIFREMVRISTDRSAEFLLVYLASASDMKSDSPNSVEAILCLTSMKELDSHFLNTKEHFVLGRNFLIEDGHYQRVEAGVVSRAVAEKIRTLPSWKLKWKNSSD